jgi:DNA-binding transcriptional LysR family regulator
LEAVFESDQLASLFALVAAGNGISLAPEMAAPAASGCKLLPLRRAAIRRIGYVHARRHFRSPVEHAFVDWLRRTTAPLRARQL